MSNYTDDDDDYGDYRDDFWGRTPQSSYFEIAKTANQNIVEKELEKVFRRLAVAEKMLETRGLEDELEREISALIIDEDIDGQAEQLLYLLIL